MSKDFEKDVVRSWSSKTELERTISTGVSGPPEIKKEEKSLYLGVFRERVLKVLTKRQIGESRIYPEIVTALKDKRASRLLIRGDIEFAARHKYQQKARELGIKYTSVFDPALKGDIGLVVASDDAVDVEYISVT